MIPIKSLLNSSNLRRSGLAKPVATAAAIECAEEVMRQFLPRLTGARVQSLRDSVLIITTESAFIAHEIHFRAAHIIAATNARMGEAVIGRIRYSIEKSPEL